MNSLPLNTINYQQVQDTLGQADWFLFSSPSEPDLASHWTTSAQRGLTFGRSTAKEVYADFNKNAHKALVFQS